MTDTTKNQVGTFIAQCRKEKKLTQKQLGEKLNVTDRAVSKWETGRSFPDVSLMEPLCQELDISVSELLAGKRLESEQYQKETEKMLMAAVNGGQLMGVQVVLYVLTLAMIVLINFPFVIRKISGLPLVNYISIFCWTLALVLVFCIDYLDKKMPARKFRTSNVLLERIIGGVTFVGIMAVNFVVSGGLSYTEGMNLTEKIYGVVIVIVGLGIVVGVRGIMAQTRKEEWEMEQEKSKDKSQKQN